MIREVELWLWEYEVVNYFNLVKCSKDNTFAY